MMSYVKLKTCLHYPNMYDHKIYQGCDILQGGPTYNLAWPLNKTFRGHVTNYITSPNVEDPWTPN